VNCALETMGNGSSFQQNHYAVLGIDSNASIREIKSAFRQQVLAHHPDKGGDRDKFEAIMQAAETLMDPANREAYHRGANAHSLAAMSTEDIFAYLEAAELTQVNSNSHQERKLRDLVKKVPVKWSAQQGLVSVEVRRQVLKAMPTTTQEHAWRPCAICKGTGQVHQTVDDGRGGASRVVVACQCAPQTRVEETVNQTQMFQVSIPANVQDGEELSRLAGYGDECHGCRAGDLVFVAEVVGGGHNLQKHMRY